MNWIQDPEKLIRDPRSKGKKNTKYQIRNTAGNLTPKTVPIPDKD
jgi:hypothetical protein